MNIFVIDEDPYIAARNLCDCHVVKMIVESCQLLSTADQLFYNLPKDGRYTITHKHHPCVRCLQNRSNYIWLVHHLKGLLLEYSSRYGKIHSCEDLLRRYWKNWISEEYDFSRTDFPKCMPEEFKNESGVVQSYRNYYRFKKEILKRFRYRIKEHYPNWLT